MQTETQSELVLVRGVVQIDVHGEKMVEEVKCLETLKMQLE